MKKIGLVVKPGTEAIEKADEFEKWLHDKGHQVVRHTGNVPEDELNREKNTAAPKALFCVFVLGGDGTFLSAVRWIGDQDTPILGIKFGDVGFLAEATEDSLFSTAENILNSEFSTKPRMRLLITVFRNGKEIARETVLNDVVISKGVLARLANIKTYINDNYLTAYRADGLIIATPTGSTAYSLAAGGPIVHPSVPGILLSPICPFTLTNRPLIVPDSVSIKIRFDEKSSDLRLTCDGQVGVAVDDRDTIVVRKGSHPINLITLPDQDYFDVLKAKLRWSGSRV
ncbi:MAG: NAD(+)/NADH kinase [Desulfobacteraceae bacterium]|nr:NAD(+)/NADH kinase [Desulfobacteraceae bacterium]